MTLQLLVPSFIGIEEDNSVRSVSEFHHIVAPNHPIVHLLLGNPDNSLTKYTVGRWATYHKVHIAKVSEPVHLVDQVYKKQSRVNRGIGIAQSQSCKR